MRLAHGGPHNRPEGLKPLQTQAPQERGTQALHASTPHEWPAAMPRPSTAGVFERTPDLRPRNRGEQDANERQRLLMLKRPQAHEAESNPSLASLLD